jgi:hypothetical protein
VRDAFALVLVLVLGCGGQAATGAPKPLPMVTSSPPDTAKRVDFSYSDLQGKEVSTTSVHGRVTVVAFIATYDVASQAQTRFLSEIEHEHTPRLNVFALVLESAENKPLADAFASALKLPYPLCMADEATIRGEGPFTGLGQVPSIVILDKEGRERYRHLGFVQKAELETAIGVVEGSKK